MATNDHDNTPKGDNGISQGEAVDPRPLASQPVPAADEIEHQSERQAKIAALPNRSVDPKKAIVLAAIACGAVVLGFSTIDALRGDPTATADKAEKPDDRNLAAYDPKTIIAPTLADAANDPNAPVTGTEVPSLDGSQQPRTGGANGRPQKSERQVIAEAQRRAGIMAYGGENGGGMGGAVAAATGSAGSLLGGGAKPGLGAGDEGGQGGSRRTNLENLRQTSQIDRVSGTDVGNRDMLILAGSFIPCVLQTAMDSSQPGYVSCIVPRDVYSDNGRVVLLEKGTRVLGEYQTGVQRGKYRLFAVWNRAVTPRGVAIDVGSPASDSLGRSGMAGGVKNFFWERFGAALLFSSLNDASSIAASEVSDADNVTRVPSQASDTILRDTLQIQPVLRINQGAEVGIMVARDFDFSKIYGLRLRRTQ